MKLSEFAEKFRVNTKRDSCGAEIIPGRPYKTHRSEDRSQVYDPEDGEHLGVTLLLSSERRWNHARTRLVSLGMTITQDGETEGNLLFDLANPIQARAAIREAGIKRRKVLSEPVRMARAARLKHARDCKAGPFGAKQTRDTAGMTSP